MSADLSPSTSADCCQACGNHVSTSFVRVFGRNGEIHACLECSSRGALSRGAGADPEHQRRVDDELTEARKQRGDTPRAMWDGRRTRRVSDD